MLMDLTLTRRIFKLMLLSGRESVLKKRFILFIAVGLFPGVLLAAGMTTHMYVAEEAIRRVADPELRSLLLAEKDAVLAGSVFPDTGNGLRFAGWPEERNYSDQTHKLDFLESYLAYVQSRCRRPYDEHCRLLLGHLMGVAAHDVEDCTYHEIFDWYVEEMDLRGRDADMDSEGDMILISRYHRGKVLPPYRLPVDDLVEIFSSLGMPQTGKEIKLGNQIHRLALFLERSYAPLVYQSSKNRLAWTMENIYSGPGGVSESAEFLARFWDALWLRLNGKDELVQPIAGVFPADGFSALPPEAEIYVMFAQPVSRAGVNSTNFVLQDAEGNLVKGRVRNHGGKSEPLVIFSAFEPFARLTPGRTYTAILKSGINDWKGRPLTREFRWSFTVAPGRACRASK
jgi:hypothetical protein